jgi:hypothetical protein
MRKEREEICLFVCLFEYIYLYPGICDFIDFLTLAWLWLDLTFIKPVFSAKSFAISICVCLMLLSYFSFFGDGGFFCGCLGGGMEMEGGRGVDEREGGGMMWGDDDDDEKRAGKGKEGKEFVDGDGMGWDGMEGGHGKREGRQTGRTEWEQGFFLKSTHSQSQQNRARGFHVKVFRIKSRLSH